MALVFLDGFDSEPEYEGPDWKLVYKNRDVENPCGEMEYMNLDWTKLGLPPTVDLTIPMKPLPPSELDQAFEKITKRALELAEAPSVDAMSKMTEAFLDPDGLLVKEEKPVIVGLDIEAMPTKELINEFNNAPIKW